MENQKTILIVDDQEVGRTLLESILYKEDFNLLFAGDGDEAFDQAKSQKPDLVLLDVMMPKSDGYQTCQRIRSDEEIRDIPIILVTALDDRDSRIRGFEAGANDYISKPIDRSELLARSRNLIKLYEYKGLVEEGKKESAAPVPEPSSEQPVPAAKNIRAGMAVNQIFSDYAELSAGQAESHAHYFYHKDGKIYGLFMKTAGDLHLLSAFQDMLLLNNPAFDDLIKSGAANEWMVLIIDRLTHTLQGWSKGFSCLIFGENKIENVTSAGRSEKIIYDTCDALIVAGTNHMQKLFESDVMQDIVQNDPTTVKLESLTPSLQEKLQLSDIYLQLFKLG